MQLDSLVGNEQCKSALVKQLQTGQLPHALLLVAPDGCGRGFAARCLAADYLFPSGGSGAKSVLAGESPELLLVQGEGKSGQIPVDTIRAVRQEVYYSSLSAAGRVVWIQDAHNMAAPAANALLKVLEEPPPDVVLILTARDASSLPLTIVSRCALFTLAPVALDVCERHLAANLPPQSDSALLHLVSILYGGRFGLALRVIQDTNRMQVLQNALSLAAFTFAGNTYEVLRILAGYEGRLDGDREAREALLSDLSDILEAPFRGAVAENLPSCTPQLAAALLPAVQRGQVALKSNNAPKITFTALAIQMDTALQHIL